MEQNSQQFSQQSTNQQQFPSQPQFTPQPQLSPQPQYQPYTEYGDKPKKKKSKVKLIILIIVLVILIGILVMLITYAKLNQEKESISLDTFKLIMEDEGFEVLDKSYETKAGKLYVASNGDYKIEFYDCTNVRTAEIYYSAYVEACEDEIDGSHTGSNIAFKNYARRVISANGEYTVVSLIDDTLLFVQADKEYKGDIKDVLEELGY